MKKAIRNYSTDVVAIVVLVLVAVFVGGYILSNQRFYLPGWVPFVGTDFYTLKAEMQTAQAITPGQGQTVAMAGVPVGEISAVTLVNGRAVVTMKIKSKYSLVINRNATILTRPKTGLNDMLLQLDPGTRASGHAPNGYTIPVSQTLPNVNPDEILASLDTGTRNYLKLLIGGAGEGLKGNRQELAATLKRFDPITRDIDQITKLLAKRRQNVAHNVHNLRLIGEALAANDNELSAFVDSSNQVFQSFANQDENLTAAIGELPTALSATNQAVISANKLGQSLGPTLTALEPFARNLEPVSLAAQDFFNTTTGVLKSQLRPFAVAAQPTVANLRPAAADLAAATPTLTTSLNVLNYVFNTLAYNPASDKGESYLFYLSWLNHLGTLLFTQQDALGPVRRGLFLLDCANAQVLDQIRTTSVPLGTLATLVNAPSKATVCAAPTSARSVSSRATKSGTAASPTAGGVGTLTQDAPEVTATAPDSPPAAAAPGAPATTPAATAPAAAPTTTTPAPTGDAAATDSAAGPTLTQAPPAGAGG